MEPPPPATELVPAVPGEAPPFRVLLLAFCGGDEVADAGGAVETAGVGLADPDADAAGVACSLGVPVEVQLVPVALAVGVLLPAGLEVASSVTVAVAVAALLAAVAAGLLVAVGLTVLVALPVGLPLPAVGLVAGLVGALDGEVDGLVGGVDGVLVGVSEPGVGAGEGDADDCGHDASGVGLFCPAGVVAAAPVAPVPLPRALPPLPGPAELAALAAWWPSRASDTDVRNGGTVARITPTAKTATPIAIAGLSSTSRQSLV